MHSIDPKWTGLADGYQTIQSCKTKLTVEFGRAVQVGHKQQLRKELTGWQKKRRVFFALVAITLLSIIALCLTSFYFREVACVIIYWAVLVLIILVTLAVSGRAYIRAMVNGKPVPQPEDGLVIDLEGRWWKSLSVQGQAAGKVGKKEPEDFLALLASSLADPYSARTIRENGVLLLGPTGIWFFIVESWSGTIVKQEGAWKQIQTTRNKLGRRQFEEKAYDTSPDDQWLQQKQELVKMLKEHLPERAWMLNLIQGGVVFSHQKVNPDKKRIQGNTASYGRPKGWVGRIRQAALVDGFTLELQLETLDVLTGCTGQQTIPAKEEAERLYQQAVEELRSSVEKMVK
jgi:hypothetical protein